MTVDYEQRDLKGRKIVITGASKGIGKKLSEKLSELGAHLFLLARNKEGDLDNVVATLRKTNEHVYGFTCDLSKKEDIIASFKKIGEITESLDVLVCNASIMIGMNQGIDDVSDDVVEATFRINVEGYYFCTKYALPLLSKSQNFDRTVVYVSSAVGFMNLPTSRPFGMIAYSTSKTAENGLMVSIYRNYGTDNDSIRKSDQKLHRVVSLHPGNVATTIGSDFAQAPKDEVIKARLNSGAVPVEEGIDTIYYLVTAKDGIESGKLYSDRKVVPF